MTKDDVKQRFLEAREAYRAATGVNAAYRDLDIIEFSARYEEFRERGVRRSNSKRHLMDAAMWAKIWTIWLTEGRDGALLWKLTNA